MERIDTSGWKSFQIGDLFDVRKGTRLTKANMKPGEIRFIGSSAMNNGLTAMISNSENVHPANTLTVCYNGSVGETFYQDKPFWASDDVNVLYPKFEMNMYIGMFIVPIIKAVSIRYNFVDKWKQEVMTVSEIKLPATSDGQPDYAYMDQYMRDVMKESEASLENLRRTDKSKEPVDIHAWGKYRVSDLFDIHPTKAYKLINEKLLDENGKNPVVVNSGFNNGVGGYTNYDCTEKAGIITFTDTAAKSVDSFFYQENDFVGYPHVQGMYPKEHNLTKSEAMFITTVLRSSVGKYNFISKMTREDILNLIIELPALSDGNPDWDYMNTYMSEMLGTTSEHLNMLAEVVN